MFRPQECDLRGNLQILLVAYPFLSHQMMHSKK